MRLRLSIAIAVIMFVPVCVSAQIGVLYTFENQHAEASKVPSVILSQSCQNFLWAAEIEFLARQQDVPLTQGEIIDHAYGGMCVDGTTNLEKLKAAVDGDHVLPDGSHVKLEMQIA